jgi:hypothetical protein
VQITDRQSRGLTQAVDLSSDQQIIKLQIKLSETIRRRPNLEFVWVRRTSFL